MCQHILASAVVRCAVALPLLLVGIGSNVFAEESRVPPQFCLLKLPGQTSSLQTGQSLFALRSYQKYISPQLGQKCNFEPSCSHYSVKAIRKYGIVKGLMMTTDRLMRCHYCAGLYYRPHKGLLEDPVDGNVVRRNES